MIVECPECQTKFRLDDSKITPKGVKVRCSKCKHVFTAKRPEDQTEPPPAKAPPPAPPPPAAPAKRTPPTHPPSKDSGGPTFDFKDETPPPQPSSESGGFDDGLGEFSFKDTEVSTPKTKKEPSEDDGFGAISFEETPPPKVSKPAPAAPENAAGPDEDFGDFDFDEEPASTAPQEPEPPHPAKKSQPPKPEAAKPKGDDFDFEEFSDFSDGAAKKKEDVGLGGDDFDFNMGAADFETGSKPPPAKQAADDNIQEFGDISLDDAKAPASPKSESPPELGAQNTEEFQLDRTEGGRSAEEFKQAVTGGGGGDAYAFDTSASEVPETELSVATRQEPEIEEPRQRMAPKPPPERSRKVSAAKKGKGGKLITFLVIIGIIGGGIYYFDSIGKIHLKILKETKFKDLNVDKLKEIAGIAKKELPKNIIEVAPIKSYDLRKVTRKDGKTLWILKGAITNRYVTPQWMILIEGKLKDGNNTVTSESLFGNILTDEQLSALSLDQINKRLMSTEDENLNQRLLLSNQSSQFMIVFTKVESAFPKLPETDAVRVKDNKAL